MSNCTVASPRSTRIPVASSAGKTGSGAPTSPSANASRNGRQNSRGANNGGHGRRGTGGNGGGGGEGGRTKGGVIREGNEGSGKKDTTDRKSTHTVIAVSPKVRQNMGNCDERERHSHRTEGLKPTEISNITLSNPMDIKPVTYQGQREGRQKNHGYSETDAGKVIVGKKSKKACTVITTIATIEYVNDRKYNLLSSPEEDEGFCQGRKQLEDIAEFGVSNRAQETSGFGLSEAGRRRQKRYLQNHMNRYSVPDYSSDSGRTSWGSSDTGVRDDISTVLMSPVGASRPCFPGNSIESFMPCNNNHHNNLNNSNTTNNNNHSNNSGDTSSTKFKHNLASPTLPSPVSSNMHLTTTTCGNSNSNSNNNNTSNSRSNSRGSLLQMQSSTSSSYSFSSSASHHPSSSSLSSPTSMSSSSTYASHIPTYHHHHYQQHRRGRCTPQSGTPSPPGDNCSDKASDSGDVNGGAITYANVVASNPSPPSLPNGLNNLIAEGRTKVGVSSKLPITWVSRASFILLDNTKIHLLRHEYNYCNYY